VNLAIHTESKTRLHVAVKERAARAAARAAYMVDRLLPIVFEHRIIGWCGWSRREQASIVLHHKPWMDTWIDRNGLLLGFPTVDAIINAVTNSGSLRQLHWFKQSNAATPNIRNWAHTYDLGGWPAPGAWNGTAFTARKHDDTELGALMHGGNVSTATKHVISGHVRTQDNTGTLEMNCACLYDLVLSYDNCTYAITLTSFTNTNTAGRYISGGDPGLQIMGAAASTQTGATSYTSVKYTSIGGTGGQTVPGPTLLQPTDSNTPGNNVLRSTCFAYTSTNARGILTVPLVSGDSGVKQLDSVTNSATTAEGAHYILGFLLAWMPFQSTDNTHAYDFVKQIPSMPQVRDGACLTFALMLANGSTSENWQAGANVAWA
jgi:hypothetical protein